MRKQTKLAVGISAAALLVIGASFASMATTRGWVNEGDEWYYYDNSGDIVTDKWKSYNGNYFYLGDDGAMVTSSLIEDGDNYYYVDANGAMVKNTWVAIEADDDEEEDVDYRWYYFQSTGKAATDTKGKSINGKKYSFDDEGKMLFGFVDDNLGMLNTDDDPVLNCTYYYGSNDNGARHSGWLRYDDAFEDDSYDDDDYEYYWFWFASNGEKRTTPKKISGKNYYFDENGVMLIEWQNQTTYTDDDGDIATYDYYYSSTVDDGSLKKSAWFYVAPEDDSGLQNYAGSDVDDDDERWFRTDSQGRILKSQTKKVNGKWYVFNSWGRMLHGLVILDQNSVSGAEPIDPSTSKKYKDARLDEDEVEGDDVIELFTSDSNIYTGDGYLYYFSDSDSDGSMKTGTSVKVTLADDDYTFYFVKTKGYGYTGIKSNKLYTNGLRRDADSDDKYEPVWAILDADTEGAEGWVLVNSSGTVQKPGSYYKDGNDDYYVCIEEDDYDYKTYGYNIYKVGDSDDAKGIKNGDEDYASYTPDYVFGVEE